jgi:hypothetical protein
MVLQLLASYGKSGILELEDNEEHASIYLKDGFIEAVSVPRSDHILGSRLVRSGKISQAELKKIVLASRFRKEREFIGLTLMKSGKVDQQAIADIIREQAYENTLELSNWIEGCFRFTIPEQPVQFPLSPHINVEHLLLEVSRRLDEGERPTRAKKQVPGEGLCAYCSAGCDAAQKKKYLRDGICLWRNMPVVVRESLYSPDEPPVHHVGEEDEEEEEVKGLPFL